MEFAALSYSAPQRSRYRFRLDNIEENWNEVDSSRRTATYTNLPGGEYVFHVQGSNSDLLWSPASARLRITVLPPWWQTWRFVTAVVVLLVTAITLVTGTK